MLDYNCLSIIMVISHQKGCKMKRAEWFYNPIHIKSIFLHKRLLMIVSDKSMRAKRTSYRLLGLRVILNIDALQR